MTMDCQNFFHPHMQCYCFAATAFSVSTATKAVKAIAVKQPCEQQQRHHHQQRITASSSSSSTASCNLTGSSSISNQ
jgi:hypothetical protein